MDKLLSFIAQANRGGHLIFGSTQHNASMYQRINTASSLVLTHKYSATIYFISIPDSRTPFNFVGLCTKIILPAAARQTYDKPTS